MKNNDDDDLARPHANEGVQLLKAFWQLDPFQRHMVIAVTELLAEDPRPLTFERGGRKSPSDRKGNRQSSGGRADGDD